MSFAEAAQRSKTHQQYRHTQTDMPRPRGPSFHHPHTSLGATGHWIHIAAVAAPLLIPEFVKDPEKKFRYLRLASVGAALASEAVWTHRLSKDRQKDEDARDALASCRDR